MLSLGAKDITIKRPRSYLREGPAAYYEIYYEIPVNTRVKLLRLGPVWSQVEYRKRSGFISTASSKAPTQKSDPFANLKRPNLASTTQGVTAGVKGFAAAFAKKLDGDMDFTDIALAYNIDPDAYRNFYKESLQGRKLARYQKAYPLPSRKQADYYSDGAEGFGLAVAGIVAKQGLYENPGMQQYINLLGTFIASSADSPEINYRFFILDISQPNAYACPGGYIFITKGMLQMVASEAELAFVLAHEIAHVSRFHGLKEIKLMENQIGSEALFAELEEDIPDSFSESAREIDAELEKDILEMRDILIEGRLDKYEAEADELALIYCSRSGYDPDASVKLLNTLINTRYESNNQHYRKASLRERHAQLGARLKRFKNPKLHYLNSLDRFDTFKALLDSM